MLPTCANGAETWAHWQLALAYARYLSPAFHAWCNSVIRTASNAWRTDARGAMACSAFSSRQFDQLHRRLDHHQPAPRRPDVPAGLRTGSHARPAAGFSARSRTLMCEVIDAEPYEGQCPCCNAARVLTADSQPLAGATFDHFFHRSLNRPEHGWLICPLPSELTMADTSSASPRCPSSAASNPRSWPHGFPRQDSRAPALSRPPGRGHAPSDMTPSPVSQVTGFCRLGPDDGGLAWPLPHPARSCRTRLHHSCATSRWTSDPSGRQQPPPDHRRGLLPFRRAKP